MKQLVYIGCRTTKERNARGKGISVYEVNGKEWKLLRILEGQINPSFLCTNQEGTRLYAVHGDYSEVSSYKIDPEGGIRWINTVGTHGTNPVHLTLDPTEQWLFVANLQTGGISVIPVLEDGSLGHIKELYFISGNGGPGHISHPHQTMMDRSGKYLFVPSQGRLQGVGKVTVFRIDSEHGTLEQIQTVKARTGAEPRHIVFHPNNRFAYLVNEKDSTVTYYGFDEACGKLTPRQILTSLPEDFFGDGWASAIDIAPDGRILYLSNRKHDSVTVYTIDQETGMLSMIQNVSTGGEQPRFIMVTPDGKELLAANELSDMITVFDVDPETGKLEDNGVQIQTESPVCAVMK